MVTITIFKMNAWVRRELWLVTRPELHRLQLTTHSTLEEKVKILEEQIQSHPEES
jgi:hypothetical protein